MDQHLNILKSRYEHSISEEIILWGHRLVVLHSMFGYLLNAIYTGLFGIMKTIHLARAHV